MNKGIFDEKMKKIPNQSNKIKKTQPNNKQTNKKNNPTTAY